MNRRGLLRNLAAIGSTVSISGCISQKSTGQDQSTTTTNTPEIQNRSTITTNSPETPTCPSFAPETERTICANTTNTINLGVYLKPDSQTFSVTTSNQTVETLGLTLQNRSAHSFIVNRGAWMIMRRTDDGWSESAAGDHTEQSITIAPETSHMWSLSLLPHPSPQAKEKTFITTNLKEGTYIFTVVGQLQNDDQTQRIECQSQFNLVKK